MTGGKYALRPRRATNTWRPASPNSRTSPLVAGTIRSSVICAARRPGNRANVLRMRPCDPTTDSLP